MSKNRLKNNNIKTSSRPPTNTSSSTSTTITSTSNNKNNSTGNNSVHPVPTLKVVLLGDLGVGKTCLRSQFVHHVFTNAYKATIGGDYLTTTILLLQDTDPQEEQDQPPSSSNGDTTNSKDPLLDTKLKEASPTKKKSKKPKITKANLQIWDTAGQERFNSISQAFYRGTDICILVYDVTNYESVLSIRDWFSRFMEHCHVEFPGVVIVGNKSDKVNDRCVDLDEIKDIVTSNTTVANVGDYIDDWDNCLCEVSAKKLEVVNDLFKRVAKVGVDLLYGYDDDDDDDDENPVKRRRLQQFDKIDLRETHNRINEQNSATSSSCAC